MEGRWARNQRRFPELATPWTHGCFSPIVSAAEAAQMDMNGVMKWMYDPTVGKLVAAFVAAK